MKTPFRFLAGAALLGLSQWVLALTVPGPVVDGEWLAKNRAELTILDVRGNAKSFTVAPEFETDKKTGKKFLVELGGHIDGAVPVDNKKVRVDRNLKGMTVKSMIPERADFEKLARSWGVAAGTTRPNQEVDSTCGRPASAVVGTSGSSGERSRLVMARPLSLPALTWGASTVSVSEARFTSPPSRAVTAGALPL